MKVRSRRRRTASASRRSSGARPGPAQGGVDREVGELPGELAGDRLSAPAVLEGGPRVRDARRSSQRSSGPRPSMRSASIAVQELAARGARGRIAQDRRQRGQDLLGGQPAGHPLAGDQAGQLDTTVPAPTTARPTCTPQCAWSLTSLWGRIDPAMREGSTWRSFADAPPPGGVELGESVKIPAPCATAECRSRSNRRKRSATAPSAATSPRARCGTACSAICGWMWISRRRSSCTETIAATRRYASCWPPKGAVRLPRCS